MASLLFYPIQNQTIYCLPIIILQLIIIKYQKKKKKKKKKQRIEGTWVAMSATASE